MNLIAIAIAECFLLPVTQSVTQDVPFYHGLIRAFSFRSPKPRRKREVVRKKRKSQWANVFSLTSQCSNFEFALVKQDPCCWYVWSYYVVPVLVLNVNCYTLAGQIQEEKEKEAQETWQKKEKEGSISVGLRAWLTTVIYGFSLSWLFTSSVYFLPLTTKNFSHPASVITLGGEDLQTCGAGFLWMKRSWKKLPSLYMATTGTYHLLTLIVMLFVGDCSFELHLKRGLKWIPQHFFLPIDLGHFSCDWISLSLSVFWPIRNSPSASSSSSDVLLRWLLDEAIMLVPVSCM